MKLLRNPYVVGALAIGAVFMVFYNVFQPQIKRWRARIGSSTSGTAAVARQAGIGQPLVPPSTPQAVKPGAKAASVIAPPPKTSGSRRVNIDADYVSAHFVEWVDSPRRDPFLVSIGYAGSATNGLPEGPNPVPTWKLTGIWRQTDGRLAAINGQVYAEGDEILGWKVERIDVDQVWFRGTNRLERLRFRQFEATPPPVQAPAPSRRSPAPRPMQEHTVSPQP